MYKGLKFLFFSILLLSLTRVGFAQDVDPENKKLAEEYVMTAEEIMAATQALDQAKDMYVLAAEVDPTNIKANYMAGDAFLRTVGKEKAVPYLLQVLKLDAEYKFDIMYHIGRSYQYGMEFEKALEFYGRYRNKLISRDGYRGRDKTALSEVERRIYECENAIEFVANPSHFSIVNVGNTINSEFEDYAPVLNEDETTMVFTSRRRDGNLNPNVAPDNKPYEDIFISHKENGQWQYAKNIGEVINTEYHGSNLALSADGNQLFIYKDDNNGDIYISERNEDDTWSTPEPLSESINSEGFKENAVSISPDGQTLFFASDRPGGYGGIDIYYSTKNKVGEWTRSKNLGEMINTAYDDDGPFIDYDGKTLYFSSQGRKGMGGYDIFRSVYDSASGKWSEPENLGFPINTPDDDIYFVSTKDGMRGYYASVREDGQGYTDIYMVTVPPGNENLRNLTTKRDLAQEEKPKETKEPEAIAQVEETEPQTNNVVAQEDPEPEPEPETDPEPEPEPQPVVQRKPDLQPVTITITVVDEDNNPLDAKVSMNSVEDNQVAGRTRVSAGVFEFKVTNATPVAYSLSVEDEGYVFQTLRVGVKAATEEPQSMSRKVVMRKLRIGTRSVLRNIYFNFDQATFKQESYNELNKLASMMSQNPGMHIEISGHTDNIGSKDYNKYLSQKRANAVKDFLVKKGIDSRRISSVGYGEERPLASNDDEKEGRELNRRVEFSVTGGK
ncbi:OmpA family protein [Fulvivirga maritima]|uniref:OmpA family protein n=1 Tax=Fulvivirga maritima TaxID=2904247 RepID=UPI001F3A74F9|nr:OmpA family protein [Fulvivirga maritima]UII29324.1 OmpA family protein [Fulvivirga maritima]